MDNDLPAPNPPAVNNVEAYLAMLAGVQDLPMPATINNNVEYYLRYLVEHGGGGGGTADFNQLINRPKYKGAAMTGNTNIPEVKNYTAGTNVSISEEGAISATDTTYNDFVGTNGVTAGTAGLVPAPATTDSGKYLKGNGTWGDPPTVTVSQTTGQSTTKVMSQKAVTEALSNKQDLVTISGNTLYI